MKTFDPVALVVGEALIDIVVDGDHRHEHPGGSPMNVAYGLGRLGVPTLLRTNIGDDDRGREILEHTRAAGVQVSNNSFIKGHTSTALATIGDDRQASYEFNIDWDVDSIAVPTTCAMLHVGSLATVLEPGATAVLDLVERAREDVLVSFDPNVRPAVTPDRAAVVTRVEKLASLSHVVKMSDEDAAWLHPDLDVDGVLDHYLGLGARLVVVTTGGAGCVLATGRHRLGQPAATVDIVDTIGAGDAFMSGLLWAVRADGLADDVRAGTLTVHDVTTLARTALASARVTVSREGANPPESRELTAALA